MRVLLFLARVLVTFCCAAVFFGCSSAEEPTPSVPIMVELESPPPGDRIASAPKDLQEWIPAALPKETYRIGPGDVLAINIQGRASLDYHVRTVGQPGENQDEVSVTPSGEMYIPLAGNLAVAGKTVAELEDLIQERLSKYIKHFQVSVSVAQVRTVNIWISGEVQNPGPQILPAVSTVGLAALQAGIRETGSTRRVTLVRNGNRRTVDLYAIIVRGSVEDDAPLQPGDSVHVPPVREYVELVGEVVRHGRFEMVDMSGGTEGFCIADLVELGLGLLPSAASNEAFVERIGDDSKARAVKVDLSGGRGSGDWTVTLQPGDKLIIPPTDAFQPMIRLIGEFKGDGVYQRAPGSTATDIENKSGIYFLKQGQTVRDVIAATGGVTPQADLKKARIDRKESDAVKAIPVDLERLLIEDDDSADVVLQNGDTLVLPAVADKIHVFGQVRAAGSYIYSPNRRLVDYLGDAGGPTPHAKLTEVRVVHGTPGRSTVIKLNAKRAIEHAQAKGNPILEAGDIVYVPSKLVGDWRDVSQLILTSVSLLSLFSRL